MLVPAFKLDRVISADCYIWDIQVSYCRSGETDIYLNEMVEFE